MKKFLKSDIFLRLASLFAAILLWIFVVYQENPVHETWINGIPVTFVNRSANFENGKLVITDGDDVKVNVKIQGRRSAVSTAKASNISCTVNLADVEEGGTYTLPISVNISSRGVSLVTNEPYNVTVEVDNVVTRERDVVVNRTGTPKQGFVEGSVEITPASVKLTGPESVINDVASAAVVLDVTDASEDIAGLYKIRLYNSEGKEITDSRITGNVEYCDVKCPILSTKVVSVSPTLSSETNHSQQKISVVSVSPDKITLVGRAQQLDRIHTVVTEPIAVSNIKDAQSVTAPLALDVISEGVLISNDVKSVKVELRAEAPTEDAEGGETGDNQTDAN